MIKRKQTPSPALITNTQASRVIDLLGGAVEVCKKLGFINADGGYPASTITQWRRQGIPLGWNAYISLRYRKILKEGGVL